MVGINTNASGQELDSALANAVEQAMSSVAITTSPILISGVNRRINIGGWEHIDVYSGLALPVLGVSTEDLEALKEALVDAAEIGFQITSQQTYERYLRVKNNQAPPDPPAPLGEATMT
jgi:hypothetical protein